MKTSTGAIQHYMVKSPATIEADRSLTFALQVMRSRRFRHLPVIRAGKLVGVITLRDIHLVETLKDVDPDDVTVEEAMTPDPYAVSHTTPLKTVARRMAREKLGSAVVVDKGNVVGIFTTVDALKVLAGLLEKKQPARRA